MLTLDTFVIKKLHFILTCGSCFQSVFSQGKYILVEAIEWLMYSVATGEGNAGVTHSQAQSINVLPKLDSTLALFLQKDMYFYFSQILLQLISLKWVYY